MVKLPEGAQFCAVDKFNIAIFGADGDASGFVSQDLFDVLVEILAKCGEVDGH